MRRRAAERRRAEVAGRFFAIPAVIVAILFPFGEATLMQVQQQETPQVQIHVEGFQWEWTFLYLRKGSS